MGKARSAYSISNKKEKFDVLENDLKDLKKYIIDKNQ